MARLRALTVTTPTHALALAIYWSQAVLGVAYLLGAAQAQAMTEIAGARAAAVWSAWLLASGATCAITAHLTAREPNPDTGLRVEFWAVLSLAAASAVYEVTLVSMNGLGVLTTQVYATTIAAGAVLRARQISVERRRLRAALDHMVRARPAPLAEPPTTEE